MLIIIQFFAHRTKRVKTNSLPVDALGPGEASVDVVEGVVGFASLVVDVAALLVGCCETPAAAAMAFRSVCLMMRTFSGFVQVGSRFLAWKKYVCDDYKDSGEGWELGSILKISALTKKNTQYGKDENGNGMKLNTHCEEYQIQFSFFGVLFIILSLF